ncbi:TPA: PDZ domain-containing protein [Candidatus Nomurabacteria bacterium]|nr:MAG: hypothetical protein O210_OD1C00001G0418 [Parcubacteria bacterium RAAC4_OD1_1]HCY26349.1 PDZ domain-containing protein [Candidatus Nomurabacteria bacterium]
MKKEILDKIKKEFKKINDSLFLKMFFMSLLSFIIIIFVFSIVLWQYKEDIKSFIVRNYIPEVNISSNNITNNEEPEILTKTGEYSVVEAVKKSKPAVVSVLVYKNVPKYEVYYPENNNYNDYFGGFFPNFFFQTPQYKENGTEEKQISSGSGFIITNNGYIVTNRHVVDESEAFFKVVLNNKKEYTAKLIAKDFVFDVAILKIEEKNLPYLNLSDSDKLEIGESVVAIGNALGEFENSVSTGVISGLSRSIYAGSGFGQKEFLDKVIQTDAAINPGNSGGPLLNLKGDVVGINVAVVQGSSNIGFALPINSVKSIIDSVLSTGKIIRPYVGIRYVPITKEIKDTNKLSIDYGILVLRGQNQSELAVVPGSPADKAGIVENDIILEIDGEKITEDNNFAYIIRRKNVGQTVSMKILSKGIQKTVSLKLEQAPEGV